MEKKMNEKSLSHIIAVGTFVLFIALGLACCVFRSDLNTNYETLEHKHQNI